jgi:hypothetical protein
VFVFMALASLRAGTGHIGKFPGPPLIHSRGYQGRLRVFPDGLARVSAS